MSEYIDPKQGPTVHLSPEIVILLNMDFWDYHRKLAELTYSFFGDQARHININVRKEKQNGKKHR